MTDIGKIDALATLDDNEDPDSEDENNSDDENGSEKEEEEVEAKENVDDLSLKIMGLGLSNDSPLLKEDLKTNGQCTEVNQDYHISY